MHESVRMCQMRTTSEEDEGGEREGRRHLHDLRHQHHVTAVAAVGHDAADEGEEQDRALPRGSCRARGRTPSAVPVSVTISQAWATFCIHVPMLDVRAPAQSSRKSR